MQVYRDIGSRLNGNCFTSDRGGQQVLVLVCHNTEGQGESNTNQDAATAQQHSDFEAQYLADNPAQVSIHWVVGEEACGAPIYRVVPEDYTAYHCGGEPGFPSSWKDPVTGNQYGGYGLNQVAIGIELVGQHYEGVGPNQQAALKTLVRNIVGRYPVLKEPGRIVAHAWLEGDRQDGRNWVQMAQKWVAELSFPKPTPQVIAVVPGKAVSPGMVAKATEYEDTIETNEDYFVLEGSTQECSMCWGIQRFYLWNATTPQVQNAPVYAYPKTQFAASTIGAALIFVGQQASEVLSMVRKSDKASFKIAYTQDYVLVEDDSANRCSVYKRQE